MTTNVPAEGLSVENRARGVIAMMRALHSHLPEEKRPIAQMDFSDEQWVRACAAYDAARTESQAQIAALNERLENNHVFNMNGEREEVLPGSIPDGIDCRNETVRLQDENISRLRAELDECGRRNNEVRVEHDGLRRSEREWRIKLIAMEKICEDLLTEAEDVFTCMADATGIDRHNLPEPFRRAGAALKADKP